MPRGLQSQAARAGARLHPEHKVPNCSVADLRTVCCWAFMQATCIVADYKPNTSTTLITANRCIAGTLHQSVQWCCHNVCFLYSLTSPGLRVLRLLVCRRRTLEKPRSVWQKNVWHVPATQNLQKGCWISTARPHTNLKQTRTQLIQVCVSPICLHICWHAAAPPAAAAAAAASAAFKRSHQPLMQQWSAQCIARTPSPVPAHGNTIRVASQLH